MLHVGSTCYVSYFKTTIYILVQVDVKYQRKKKNTEGKVPFNNHLLIAVVDLGIQYFTFE